MQPNHKIVENNRIYGRIVVFAFLAKLKISSKFVKVRIGSHRNLLDTSLPRRIRMNTGVKMEIVENNDFFPNLGSNCRLFWQQCSSFSLFGRQSLQARRAETMVDGLPRAYRFGSKIKVSGTTRNRFPSIAWVILSDF